MPAAAAAAAQLPARPPAPTFVWQLAQNRACPRFLTFSCSPHTQKRGMHMAGGATLYPCCGSDRR